MADPYVSVPMIFSDPKPGFKVTVYLLYLQVQYLKTVRLSENVTIEN